ncbi:hypothetical protein Tsubulata_002075 [Turnera subulata]|uniref:Pentacotripeptide-repeat region of PRORP domain-containing protein n=1 Tax=Turnera subulata TaxID=218843 RepID=A0A9Q0JHC2_9ROSI|nr:hypothetical protein Tsubulata_002075 [Turnera subulata]
MSAASILNRLLSSANLRAEKTQPSDANALTNTILTFLNKPNNNRPRPPNKRKPLQEAVDILFPSPFPIPFPLYHRLFSLCSSSRAVVEARKLESHLVRASPNPPVFLLNRAIEAYGACGCLPDARSLFDEMPHRDGGSWNALIKAHKQCGNPQGALLLFRQMTGEGVPFNEITLACALGSCGIVLAFSLLRQIHGLVVKSGFSRNVILGSSLVDVYGKCKAMPEARAMFDEIEFPNDVTWNVIIRRYLEVGDWRQSLIMFSTLCRRTHGVRPLSFTYSNALVACSEMRALPEGMQIHGVLIKIGLDADEVVLNSLIDVYVKCQYIDSARRVFDQPCSRDLISWTSVVSGYAMSGRMREARDLFNRMPERNVISWNAMLAGYTRHLCWEEALDFVCFMCSATEDIDHVTLGLMLNVSSGLRDIEMGKQIHGFIYRHDFASNVLVGNALLNMYGKCGDLASAREWFYQMRELRDTISWNALLNTYARHGQSEQAMAIFGKMQVETKPSKFTFGTLLAACANMFALYRGKQIHGFMIRHGYDLDTVIRGALVDMYSKCRGIRYALMVYREATERDLILWNSIILGCCHNGRGKTALHLFHSGMKDGGLRPDHITFKGILLACICEGDVELGVQYFNAMSNEYCIIPRLEHYECMIELFSRNGCMNELKKFVTGMPFDPTAPMLTRILS